MRTRLFLLAASAAATLAACSTAPREPAPIIRGGSSTGASGLASPCANVITVRRGDTLYDIARRNGLSADLIARENRLRPPYALSPGQSLRLPGPAIYRVRRGNNLYRIGLAHGMTTQEIAALNGLRPPYELMPGQELRVCGPVRDVPTGPGSGSNSGDWQPPEPGPGPVPPPPPPPPPPPVANASFAWPLDGPVVSRFGQAQGQLSNGIRIQARMGEPVRAAADGEVVYAGNELAGYGELVLIRHEGRWVTAYGLNSEILVQEGQRVTAGQHIANAGDSGDGNGPALHFEIRRGVTPVDPQRQLPAR